MLSDGRPRLGPTRLMGVAQAHSTSVSHVDSASIVTDSQSVDVVHGSVNAISNKLHRIEAGLRPSAELADR
ncbi:MAG: hypothetical protein HKN47_11850 [Pirellulaceae bacterium]|nr:hypothetical protein [Pirellulaceae bacterium]